MDEKLKDELTGALWGLVVLTIISLLVGCKTTRYVPVPSVSVDSVYVDRWHRDSVYLRDSVFVNRWTAGDTVFIDKVVTKYEYKDRWIRDTISVLRSDTTTIIKQVEVEKDLTWWQETQIGGFWLLAAAILLCLAVKNRGKITELVKKTT